MAAEAQENQTSSQVQEEQQKSLVQRIKELGASVNLTLPQDGNLTDLLRALNESSTFSNLSQQLSQEISKLGINVSDIRDLQQESNASLAGLIEKFQNLTGS